MKKFYNLGARSGDHFPVFAFSQVIDVRKYGYVRAYKTGRHVTQKENMVKNEPLACLNRTPGKTE